MLCILIFSFAGRNLCSVHGLVICPALRVAEVDLSAWHALIKALGPSVNWTVNNHSETEEKHSGVLGQVWPSPQVCMALGSDLLGG